MVPRNILHAPVCALHRVIGTLPGAWTQRAAWMQCSACAVAQSLLPETRGLVTCQRGAPCGTHVQRVCAHFPRRLDKEHRASKHGARCFREASAGIVPLCKHLKPSHAEPALPCGMHACVLKHTEPYPLRATPSDCSGG